ncbi:sulfatase [Paludibacter propionicigenes WB4]|uniref:Sulfatase n=1 Tax=Paludibacter propionicigenes (strain DSM 17365 / JCM 13257 / WB4) TaxID=694427 RepID=E4T4V4_PALPW|nr:arylsulfatase [Paludibacter propionicigenes]ADQ79748.1 sulfatase [Paludibacter propionicigenes WB4]
MTNNKFHLKTAGVLASSILAGTGMVSAQSISKYVDKFPGVVGRTLSDSKEARTQNPKAPVGSPNVLWILIDDVGFGASSAFGGLINTPNLDELANNGLRYTNFHTCAISAPTRASLLTGRNSSTAHMAGFGHESLSAGFPAWEGRIPSETGTIAEILRDRGYSTFAVGKYGLTPDADTTDVGPFDRWPTGKGFDHFFGFLGSATDQYKPDLVNDNEHVRPDGRHLNEQITDKAIAYITRQHRVAPDKPFFLYYSPGAVHAPHQVDKEWSDKYKGKFDKGWDWYREEVFARQKKLGIIPLNAKLPARDTRLKAWRDLSVEQQKLYARFFEVYAGFLEYTDYEIGRLIQYLRNSGLLENTAVFAIIGDNGASKEGTFNGVIDKGVLAFENDGEFLDYNLKNIDKIGTPSTITSANYPLAWAQATNTPFRNWKQDAYSEGGTRNPLIVYYPKVVTEKGGIRTQYGHVIDVLPTTLDLIGIQSPSEIRNIKQDSIHGTSLFYSLNDAKAPSRHTLQHYYIFGARSVYKAGWKAAAPHHPDYIDLYTSPKAQQIIPRDPNRFDTEKWELYNLNEDFNETNDLAAKYPEKLKELKTLFEAQAKRYGLAPYIDWADIYEKRLEFEKNRKK